MPLTLSLLTCKTACVQWKEQVIKQCRDNDLGESMCIWGRDGKAHGNIVASAKWVGGIVTVSAFLFGFYLL